MSVVSMSNKEFARLDVLLGLEARRIQIADACSLLGLKRRQVFRLLLAFFDQSGAGRGGLKPGVWRQWNSH